ncbi:MAG: GAK system CofD-like protein [Desulfobulbaceae bacterium]|nr:GAK system CofD-like protein [Desulfobulbaceae bacterium]
MRLTVQRKIAIPDKIKIARYQKAPELGPRILFFSGGSALRSLSRLLKKYTYNSIHVITAFDSGGSSAVLRRAFKMLAIGDLRARLMDLADQSILGNPEIYDLFVYRFSKDADSATLAREFHDMVQGEHPLVQKVHHPMRRIIRNHLFWFQQRMPAFFDLRGASVGNLILTAGYLENRSHPDPVIYIFSRLIQAKGTVRPIINRYLHLVAELLDGSTVVGQHMITGKEVAPLQSKIKKIYLAADADHPEEISVSIRDKMRKLISDSELICYPMGSFYSSIVANILPRGVGAAIASNSVPKIYVPNTGYDPECVDMSVTEQVHKLVEYGCRDGVEIAPSDIVKFVVVDGQNGSYQGKMDKAGLKQMGIEVIDCRLISERTAPLIDEELLLPVLLSLT